LLSSGGICLDDATNNVDEYNAVIELLCNTLLHGISHLRLYLDAQMVLSQLNGVYHVYDPSLHRRFLRVRLLECYLDYVMYIHVPRRLNQIIYTQANQVLDWNVVHI
jgi:ribonuclease HI